MPGKMKDTRPIHQVLQVVNGHLTIGQPAGQVLTGHLDLRPPQRRALSIAAPAEASAAMADEEPAMQNRLARVRSVLHPGQAGDRRGSAAGLMRGQTTELHRRHDPVAGCGDLAVGRS